LKLTAVSQIHARWTSAWRALFFALPGVICFLFHSLGGLDGVCRFEAFEIGENKALLVA